MKVLYITHYFLPDTAARVSTEEIIKMLLCMGHKVTLIGPNTFVKGGLTIQESAGLKIKSSWTLVPYWVARKSKLISMLVATLGHVGVFVRGFKVAKQEGRFNLMIVQYHAFHLAPFVAYLLFKFARVPFIVKVHDVVPSSPTGSRLELIYDIILLKINRLAWASTSCILSLSPEITHILSELLKVDISKAVVFPNSISQNFCCSKVDALEFRSHLGLVDKKVVLYIGDVFEDRGLEVLLKAMSLVNDERVVAFVVGDCGNEFIELARRLGVGNNVHFAGKVSHSSVPFYIGMADVCVGPLMARSYTYGGVPRKVLEYMACGKPVILAKSTVTEDLTKGNLSAVVVDSDNEREVASAIVSLAKNNRLSETIGRRARVVVAERYNTEKFAEKLNEILQNLIDSKSLKGSF